MFIEHTGTDFRAAVGTNVFSTRRGVVVHAGWGGSYGSAYGNYVVVESWHKFRKIQHLYAHLSKTYVTKGERVVAGQRLGKSGETGNTRGPHLHYEERTYPFNYWAYKKPVLLSWWPKSKKVVANIKKRMASYS